MTPIKISAFIKPELDVTLGYSGGMALYVADWDSVLLLFWPTNVPFLSYKSISNTPLN